MDRVHLGLAIVTVCLCTIGAHAKDGVAVRDYGGYARNAHCIQLKPNESRFLTELCVRRLEVSWRWNTLVGEPTEEYRGKWFPVERLMLRVKPEVSADPVELNLADAPPQVQEAFKNIKPRNLIAYARAGTGGMPDITEPLVYFSLDVMGKAGEEPAFSVPGSRDWDEIFISPLAIQHRPWETCSDNPSQRPGDDLEAGFFGYLEEERAKQQFKDVTELGSVGICGIQFSGLTEFNQAFEAACKEAQEPASLPAVLRYACEFAVGENEKRGPPKDGDGENHLENEKMAEVQRKLGNGSSEAQSTSVAESFDTILSEEIAAAKGRSTADGNEPEETPTLVKSNAVRTTTNSSSAPPRKWNTITFTLNGKTYTKEQFSAYRSKKPNGQYQLALRVPIEEGVAWLHLPEANGSFETCLGISAQPVMSFSFDTNAGRKRITYKSSTDCGTRFEKNYDFNGTVQVKQGDQAWKKEYSGAFSGTLFLQYASANSGVSQKRMTVNNGSFYVSSTVSR